MECDSFDKYKSIDKIKESGDDQSILVPHYIRMMNLISNNKKEMYDIFGRDKNIVSIMDYIIKCGNCT